MRTFLVAMVFVSLIGVVLFATAGNIARLLDIRRYEALSQYTLAQAALVDEQAEYLYAQTLQAMAARQSASVTALYVVIAVMFLILTGAALALVLAVVQLKMTQATLYQLSAGNAQQLQPGQRYSQPVQIPVNYPQEARQ